MGSLKKKLISTIQDDSLGSVEVHQIGNQMVYHFKPGQAEGSAKMKNDLGGKGANLAEMSNTHVNDDIGYVPVPAGATITTEVANYFLANNNTIPEGMLSQVLAKLKVIEGSMNMEFGNPDNPLLLSVRSGARASMPGMMDTVLNLGMNDDIVQGLLKKAESMPEGEAKDSYIKSVWDNYRRFLQMYTDVVLSGENSNLKAKRFDSILHQKKAEIAESRNVAVDTIQDQDLSAKDLAELVDSYKAHITAHLDGEFPIDPMKQLIGAIEAVFVSWNCERAIVYRRMNHIPHNWGTAVNFQAMVFGNRGNNSGTGVLFTRNPQTGEDVLYGEWLPNAQGEDVVAGIRTPFQLSTQAAIEWGIREGIPEQSSEGEISRQKDYPSLEESMPAMYTKLMTIIKFLEKHYGDIQDIEFTIQEDELWILQTRDGKRTGMAAIKIANDLVAEGLANNRTVVKKLDAGSLNQLFAPIFDHNELSIAYAAKRVLAKGLNASPGDASGAIAFTAEEAEVLVKAAEDRGETDYHVILVRHETSPDDIEGMRISSGIMTARGGGTSHAAVVARQMGKPCIVGCSDLVLAEESQDDGVHKTILTVGGKTYRTGDIISMSGTTGEVFSGAIKTSPSEVRQVLAGKIEAASATLYNQFRSFMNWSDTYHNVVTRANSDAPEDAAIARKLGAEGIGLTRTEHMFFEDDRLPIFQQMIMALSEKDNSQRVALLQTLLPMQKADFQGIFKSMEGLPVTIRLLDPPLHEFEPGTENGWNTLSQVTGTPIEELKLVFKNLHEVNPMMGHRGIRLGMEFPEIYEMQIRAILEAAADEHSLGNKVVPEIMFPFVTDVGQLEFFAPRVKAIAEEVSASRGLTEFDYKFGTMIETPAAVKAIKEIAGLVDFMSVGSNDMTQFVLALSRDDSPAIIEVNMNAGVWKSDPFVTLHEHVISSLEEMIIEARTVNPDIKIGLCGEHGGDPESVRLVLEMTQKLKDMGIAKGFDYLSMSTNRVPVARQAAAQSTINLEDSAQDNLELRRLQAKHRIKVQEERLEAMKTGLANIPEG